MKAKVIDFEQGMKRVNKVKYFKYKTRKGCEKTNEIYNDCCIEYSMVGSFFYAIGIIALVASVII